MATTDTRDSGMPEETGRPEAAKGDESAGVDASGAAQDEAEDALSALPEWMAQAFEGHGFTNLTAIQQAVLAQDATDRDLRITSATGSGKTVAVAMAVAPEVERAIAAERSAPRTQGQIGPSILVIAPTRELATQLKGELTWIYGPLHAKTALVLGGGAYGQELRQLRRGPQVLVGTPGRLLDHVKQGNVDLSSVDAVVLDEADQLLELGFKAELDAIIGACPDSRRTLLVSATFGPNVRQLADRHQNNALKVEGTRSGAAHADIAHLVHPVAAKDQMAALINILLAAPAGRCLVFVAMRAQASQISGALAERGFDAAGLSGEMSQAERSRTLDAFRKGTLRVLVATDVAARGIDVQEIRTVIHACPPRDVEALIHRSGRTGRAGQQGTSIQMATPGDIQQVRRVLRQARIDARWVPVPGRGDVQAVIDERMVESIGEAMEQESPGHALRMARRLLEDNDPEALIAHLIERSASSEGCTPQDVQAIAIPELAPRRNAAQPRPARGREGPRGHSQGFVLFEVNWGERRGATPPRLMAMLCRRGGVDRVHLGHIEVREMSSRVEVAEEVAEDFAHAAGRRDSRDSSILIRPVPSGPPARGYAQRGGGAQPPRRAPTGGGRSQGFKPKRRSGPKTP